MYLTKLKKPMLAALLLVMAGGFSGCSESDGDLDDVVGNGGGNGGGGGGGEDITMCPIDGTALCAIPEIGPTIVEGAGGLCPDDAGMLDPLQLCAVPGVGPALVENICGGPCPDMGDGGAESPLSIEQLCAIPELGPQIVSAAGGMCPDAGGDAPSTTLLHDNSALGPVVDPLDEALVTPLSEAGASVLLEPVADTVANPLLDALGADNPDGGGGAPGVPGLPGLPGAGGVPGPEQLCAIPAPIGPALADAAMVDCGAPAAPGAGGTCLPGDPTGMLCLP